MEVRPVPDTEFCKKLYALDPDLFLNWDPACGRWSVWHKDPYDGSINHVVNVMDPNGAYRPLDDRVIQIIHRNRWYAQHPEELKKVLLTDPEEEQKKSDQRTKDNIKLLEKDKAFKREWDKTIDKVKQIPWAEWTTPKKIETMVNEETGERKDIWYKPPKDMLGAVKPSTAQAEEIANATTKRIDGTDHNGL